MLCAVWCVALCVFLLGFDTLGANPVDHATDYKDYGDEYVMKELHLLGSTRNRYIPFDVNTWTSNIAKTTMAIVPPDSLNSFVCVGKDARGIGRYEFRPLNETTIFYGSISTSRTRSNYNALPAYTTTIECRNTRGESKIYDLTKCPRLPTKRKQKRTISNNPFCKLPQFALNELPNNPANNMNQQDNMGNNNQQNAGNNHQGNGGNNNQGNGGNNNPGMMNRNNNQGNRGNYQGNNAPNRHVRMLRNPSPDSSFPRLG